MVATLLLAPLLAGPANAQAPVVRDSAGITIIESSPPPPGSRPPIRVADRPMLQIGAEDRGPNYQFNDIAAATRLRDGSIAVADRGSGEIRIFDGSGRFVRKVGRRGEGPGESRRLSHIRAMGDDSLLAWDALGGRFTIFTPAGRVARTFTARADPERVAAFGLVRELLGDGSFFGYRLGRHPPPPVKAVVRDTLLVALYTGEGKYVSAVGRFLGLQTLQHTGGTMPGPTGVIVEAFSVAGVPFPRETLLRAGSDWLYAGDGETTYEILGYNRGGSLKRVIRVRQDPQRVTPEVIARHRAEPRGRDTPARPNPRPNIDVALYPKTMPAYAAFRVDAAQRLWVKDYPAPGEKEPRWNVFDPGGKLLGSVPTPPGVDVLEIGTTHLLGVWRDELDVEHVRLYALSPGS